MTTSHAHADHEEPGRVAVLPPSYPLAGPLLASPSGNDLLSAAPSSGRGSSVLVRSRSAGWSEAGVQEHVGPPAADGLMAAQ
jgi:hypothetical protein